MYDAIRCGLAYIPPVTRGPSDGADAGTSSPPEREDATFAGAATRALEAAAEVGLAVPDDDGVGVLVQSSSGVIEAATPQAAALLGLTLPQMLGRDSADRRWAAVDEDGKALRGQDHPSMRAVSSGMVVRDAVIGVHRPGHDPAGHHVWLAVDAVPYGPAGTPDRVVVRFSVITGPRATELRLAASERLYRFLVEYDPDIVAWQLPDTTFLWVSSAARTLLGHEPAEMIGRAAYEFMHPDDVPVARLNPSPSTVSNRDRPFCGCSTAPATICGWRSPARSSATPMARLHRCGQPGAM